MTRAASSSPRNAAAKADPPDLDLLSEPLLTIRHGGERVRLSLPDVLERLGSGEVDAFPSLQAHQQHAWHAFLVQLAAFCLPGADDFPRGLTADEWRSLLRHAGGESREAWCLIVPELSKPGFMQPPVLEDSWDGFKEPVARPDLLDVLVLSRNHDVKMGRIALPDPEHWVYALVSLQTMQGYSGPRLYGIARMNGGYGSRPGMSLAPGPAPGERFVRDLRRILEGRESVLESHSHYAREGGRGLLWVDPWDGNSSATIEGLDPWFIEVCRRVRLEHGPRAIQARYKPTGAPRLAGGALKGITGDPWTPVSRAKATAFTASENGFDYVVVQRLLGDEFEPGLAMQPGKGEAQAVLRLEVLARGQGQTSGYHQRSLPVPAHVVRRLGNDVERTELGALAKARVETAATVAKAVLRPALLNLVQGAPDDAKRLDRDDPRPRPWLARFHERVDTVFFERLWGALDRPAAEGRADWERELLALARSVLEEAMASPQGASASRYRGIAGAERMFEACQRKQFRQLFDEGGVSA